MVDPIDPIDPLPLPVCGDDDFDHTQDTNKATDCSEIQEKCSPADGESCVYCNDSCRLTTIE